MSKECRDCRHFRNDAAFLEDLFKGLTALSSADASSRADDGVCLLHQRFLSARSSCAHFSAAAAAVKVA
jgi:hypothetical protein